MARRCSGSLYELLEVQQNASLDDIKKSYRRIALKIHPDKTGGTTTVQFQRVKAAHDLLLDPKQRKVYDAFGSAGMQQMQSMGLPAGMPVALRNMAVILFLVALLLLIQVSLLVTKVDRFKKWTWQNTLTPLWILLSFAFLGVLASIATEFRELTAAQVLPLGTLLFFLIGVSLSGHAVSKDNLQSEWRAAFMAGYFPSMVMLCITSLASLTLSNVRAFLSLTPQYRFKLDVLENMTYCSWAYLQHALPAYFELATTVAFYCTWYARAATDKFATLSFWHVFAPLLVRYAVNMAVKMVFVVMLAQSGETDGYRPVGENGEPVADPQKPRVYHALFVPFLYFPSVYTVCMLAAKLEAEVNRTAGQYDPSLGVAMLFVFIFLSLLLLFSCCGACMAPIQEEKSAADSAAAAEEGGASSHPEASQSYPTGGLSVNVGAPSEPPATGGYQSMID